AGTRISGAARTRTHIGEVGNAVRIDVRPLPGGQHRWNCNDVAFSAVRPLVVTKEECLVLDNGTTQRSSILVELERRFGSAGAVGEKLVCIQLLVAQKLKESPM